MSEVRIHPTADVHSRAEVGSGTQIWNQSQVREGAHIGSECVLGKNVYVDFGVSIGNRTKIQNNVSVYHGVTIEDGVFIGPHVCFCNDQTPRAITRDGQLKRDDDWTVGPVTVRHGASIGAGSIILPDVTIGRFALVGAGSVVTRSVPDHALVYGNPAQAHGYVCECGSRLDQPTTTAASVSGHCPTCQQTVTFRVTQ
jgi:UDP-2-acetamido-3-amino-2,3-dideoxy-glucuronate N-acetyltransferase